MKISNIFAVIKIRILFRSEVFSSYSLSYISEFGILINNILFPWLLTTVPHSYRYD